VVSATCNNPAGKALKTALTLRPGLLRFRFLLHCGAFALEVFL